MLRLGAKGVTALVSHVVIPCSPSRFFKIKIKSSSNFAWAARADGSTL
eukprot:SAG31_NODE_3643_length_4030_cov_3.758586_1_plen_48_part_00